MPRTRTSMIYSVLATLVLVVCAWTGPAHADGFGGTVTQGAAPTLDGRPNSTCPPKPALAESRSNGSVGDPVWTYDGSLHLNYTDLVVGRNFPIAITRLYDSRSEYDSAIGYGWAFSFDRRLFEYPDGSIVVRSGCGSRSRFVLTGGAYVAPLDGMQSQLTALGSGAYELRHPNGSLDRFDADGRLSKIVSANGAQHELVYDSRGRLPLIGTSARGLNPNAPMLVAYQPRVTRIQERGADGVLTGYYVDFQYNDTTGRVTKIIANDGREVNYGFDVAGTATRGNLVSVTGLNDYSQTFAYVVSSENPDQHNITSITNGTGAQAVINKYDAQDRVYQQIEQITTWNFTYPSAGRTDVQQQVKATDGTGAVLQTRTTTYLHDAGGYLTKEIDALGHETRYIYDGNRDITRTELWEKQGTTLVLLKAADTTYNGQGQPLTQTVTLDPVGGQAAEVITTTLTYDNGWVASEQTVSNKFAQIFRTEYTFVRDAQNRPVAIASVKRRKDNGTFATTAFTYCTAAEAAAANSVCPDTAPIKQVDGPRTDVADIATFTYYGTTDTSGCAGTTGNCWRRGDRKTIVNALGQSIEFQRYDAAGRATKVRDANNVIAELSYHPRGWVLQQIVRGPNDTVTTDDQITGYTYDARGNVTRITSPDGNYADLTYDARDRLEKIRDLGGNELITTYDSAGNPQTSEAWATVPSSALKRKQRWIVDPLDRVIEAQGSTTDKRTLFAYDAAGRQTLTTDANNVLSAQTYDDLDRLIATVADSASGGIQASTGMAYDAVGNLRAVIDPKGLTTSYVYDALGRLTQQISPDSGTTNFTYDDAGNLLTRTDARGITATMTYDALNRPLTTSYPTAAENVTYQYDTANAVCIAGETFAVGRLTKMTDQSGTTAYCYDRFGNLTRKVQTTGGVAHTLRYSYDLANQLASQTYPDGTVLDYLRDTQSRVQEIGVTVTGGTRQVLLNQAKYLPAGPANSWQTGNGRTLTRSYDQDYRATGVRDPGTGGLDIGYVYDSASYLIQITTLSTNTIRAKFYYDALGRLTTRTNAADSLQESYGYDKTGNRTSVLRPSLGIMRAYSYEATSHRLTDAGDGVPRTYSANGNLLVIGDKNGPGGAYDKEFFYNDANRLKQVNTGNAGSTTVLATYVYNGRGEQVQRQTSATTRFVYDEAGQLIGQYDNTGTPIQQYIWLGGHAVGMMTPAPPPQEGQPAQPAKLWYVQTDALGSPRAILDPVRNLAVWRWDENGEGFGDTAPNTDPDNDGTQVAFDLRFPGQRYDQASGLYYNYYRDYDPSVGRYTQSDPIGLAGGISTYAYVGSMPTGAIDPSGLESACFSTGVGCGLVPITPEIVAKQELAMAGLVGMVGVAFLLPEMTVIAGDALFFTRALGPMAGLGTAYATHADKINALGEAAALTAAGVPSPASLSGVVTTESAACKTFTSSDRYVADLANKIETAYPGHVLGVNVNLYRADGSVAAEADILLKNSVLQIKGGSGTGMARQLARTEREFGLPALGYGPNLGREVMRNTASTNNESLIIEVVKPDP